LRPSLHQLRLFIRLSRPLFLLGGVLLYGLGAALARFLGRPVNFELYLAGQALVTAGQLTAHYLDEYFDAEQNADNPNRTFLTGGSRVLGPGGLPARLAMQAAIVCMGFLGILASTLLVRGIVPLLAWLVFALLFFGSVFYSAPPIRLVSTGYGEVAASVLIAGLVPTFGFVMQTGGLHRLLLMSTTPLVALHFAMLIAFGLPDYGSDLKHDKRTLLVRLGWQTGMRLHDAAILFAILSGFLAYLDGLPMRVALGSLIALPLGLAQIWQMARLRRGYPPNWGLLTFSALGLFSLAAYLELAGFLLS
jgi:1,4-dihydroxy-2-naphthoate octaprenyltransferase